MINLDKASILLNNPMLPYDSLITLEIEHKVIASSLELEELFTDCLVEKIKKISIGKKAKNQIENIVDFDSDESIKDFFKDKISILKNETLDINSDIVTLSFSVSVYYVNREQIVDEKDILKDIISMKFKSFFMEVEI